MSLEGMGNEKMRTQAPEQNEHVLEDAFVSAVHGRIIESMSEALEEAGFSTEEERAFRKHLASLPLAAVNGVLSMPHELRNVRLSKLHERVERGEQISEIVDGLSADARKHGFTIGFHMSNSDILPKRTKTGESWTVDGKEQDHRDNDLPMAYYSTDLANLYANKRARYLYIIRAEKGEGTTHRQDNDGSWGRAPKLDIVEKLEYERVMQEARERAKEKEKASLDAA